MNIKEKLFLSWNICLIALILIFVYFSLSWHIDKLLHLNKINGVLEYIIDTKDELDQEDVNYILNKIKQIGTN